MEVRTGLKLYFYKRGVFTSIWGTVTIIDMKGNI